MLPDTVIFAQEKTSYEFISGKLTVYKPKRLIIS